MNGKKVWLLILLTVVVFAGLVSYGDYREMGGRLANFPVPFLLGSLALAAVNYGIRFLRWAYYLRVLGIGVPLPVSVLVFLSGLAMSVTPGKMGELLKSYLLRDRSGVPVSTSAPVVVMERVTDVVSVALLGLTGLALLPWVVSLLLAIILLVGGVLMFLVASRHSDRLLALPIIRRWKSGLQSSRDGLRSLMLPRPMAVAVFLGSLAWLSEGVALWLIMRGFGAEISLVRALPIYAAATLVGAVSTLPGGLIGTEGTMVALLQQSGVARGVASAGTLLVRLVTLWFAVLVGLIALVCLNKFLPAPLASTSGE